MSHKKKVIIVSGGSRGLGLETVKHLVSEGCVVGSFSRSMSEDISTLISKCKDKESLYWETLDITDCETLKEFVLNVYKKYGQIDGLINNAGVNLDKLLTLTSDVEISNNIDVNLKSVILLTKYVSKFMIQQNFGKIINISSILGNRGYKGCSVYSSSKAALQGFTRSLARELGGKKINVNAIAPGFLETKMTSEMSEHQMNQIIRRTPLDRLGKVTDITGAISFLLSNEADFITGQTLTIDGGLTC